MNSNFAPVTVIDIALVFLVTFIVFPQYSPTLTPEEIEDRE
ncbi:hypothetical protein [Methanococcoides orientis]|nr:hypothetical protein [Methanococcoides orientis]